MKKERLMYGASAAALALSGVMVPVNVMAEETPGALAACLWTTDTTDDTPTSCAASTFAQFYYGVNNARYTSVRLDADIVTDRLMGAFKTMTIDLNGHKLSRDTNGLIMKVGQYSSDASKLKKGDLTIIDSAGGGEIVSDAEGQAVFQLENASSLTINGGALTAKQYTTVTVYDGSSVYINDGSLTSGTREVIGGNNAEGDMNTYVTGGTLTSAGGYPTIYMPSQVNLKVSGDAVLNGSILVRMGQIEISGGTIHSAAREYTDIADGIEYSGLVALPGVINVLGGSYKSDNAKYGNSLNLNITGGSLISENSSEYGGDVVVYDLDGEAQEMNVNISGGTFTVKGAQAPVAVYDRDDLKLAPIENDIQNTTAVEVTGGTYNAEPGHVKPGYKAYAGNDGLYRVLPDGISADSSDNTGGSEATANEVVLQGVANEILTELITQIDTLKDGQMISLASGTKFIVDDADAIRAALLAGEDVSVDLYASTLREASEKELTEEADEADEVGEVKEFKVIDYMVAMYADGEYAGRVTELPAELSLEVSIANAPELPERVTRTWMVTREHNGEVEELDAEVVDDLLTFASNMFSTFTIAYLDTLGPVVVPDDPDTGMFTGDSVASQMGAGAVIMTVLAMVTAAIAMEIRTYKRRQDQE